MMGKDSPWNGNKLVLQNRKFQGSAVSKKEHADSPQGYERTHHF